MQVNRIDLTKGLPSNLSEKVNALKPVKTISNNSNVVKNALPNPLTKIKTFASNHKFLTILIALGASGLIYYFVKGGFSSKSKTRTTVEKWI